MTEPFRRPGMPSPELAGPSRRRVLGLLASVFGANLVLPGLARAAGASDIHYFRIGTGATSGTYFPLGGEIASALSAPEHSRPCDRGGSCGIPGMIAVALSTQGSVENLDMVAAGTVDSALCQADVAAWAYAGTDLFAKKGAQKSLRALASLYSESLHIVVRADGPIQTVKDLKGKRISLGEPESGTLVDAKAVLSGFGMSQTDLKANNAKLSLAAQGLADGTMDGFFQIGGWPIAAIGDLATSVKIRLVPVPPEILAKLKKKYGFLAADTIPAGTYDGMAQDVPTVGINAQWVGTDRLADDLAYGLVKTLWHPSTRRLLDQGHPIGKRIAVTRAVDGLGLPLHPGAARYYREIGLTPPAE